MDRTIWVQPKNVRLLKETSSRSKVTVDDKGNLDGNSLAHSFRVMIGQHRDPTLNGRKWRWGHAASKTEIRIGQRCGKDQDTTLACVVQVI